MSKIPYYWVNDSGRAYWRPNKRMASLGFNCVALGEAGPDAEQQAREWYERWQRARSEDATALGVRREAARPPAAAQFVYFLQIGDRVKIGFSSKPLQRLAELVGGAHGRMTRVLVVSGTRADEKRLHARYAPYRTGGEWFAASRPVLLTIGRSAAAGCVVHDDPSARTKDVPRVESPAYRESKFSEQGDLNA